MIGVIGSIIIAVAGSWVQLNQRISILEVQDMLGEINVKVSHLNDVKVDRPFVDRHQKEGGE